jgi:hypothetical protein
MTLMFGLHKFLLELSRVKKHRKSNGGHVMQRS